MLSLISIIWLRRIISFARESIQICLMLSLISIIAIISYKKDARMSCLYDRQTFAVDLAEEVEGKDVGHAGDEVEDGKDAWINLDGINFVLR